MIYGWLLLIFPANSSEVLVAVAANFSAPMQKIAQSFEKDTGHRLVVATGSTGRFYSQIKLGAPFQILLAADIQTPEKLAKEGFALDGSQFTYASGKLVLWSKKIDYVNPQVDALKNLNFNRLAMADPKLAPYGLAASQVIQRLGLADRLTNKIVMAENISQAYQFVETENAELGFVAMSQVWMDGHLSQGSGWVVPTELYSPIQQNAILLKPGIGQPAALAFMEYLKSGKIQKMIQSHGYDSGRIQTPGSGH